MVNATHWHLLISTLGIFDQTYTHNFGTAFRFMEHFCLKWLLVQNTLIWTNRDVVGTPNYNMRLFSRPLFLYFLWSYRGIGNGISYTTGRPSRDHCSDVIMGAIASQITSPTTVYPIVYSDADQGKHQSSASLAFVRRIHRDRWIPRTNGQ